MLSKDIRKHWDRFMISQGFERENNSSKSHFIFSDFSAVVVTLDYAPIMKEYSPMCSIYLRHLGITPLDVSTVMEKSESYNYMYFSVSSIVEAHTQDAILGVRGEDGLHPKDVFFLMLEQNETYVLPVLKQCLNEKGFIDFYKKYNTQDIGLVCKDLRAWAEQKLKN